MMQSSLQTIGRKNLRIMYTFTATSRLWFAFVPGIWSGLGYLLNSSAVNMADRYGLVHTAQGFSVLGVLSMDQRTMCRNNNENVIFET